MKDEDVSFDTSIPLPSPSHSHKMTYHIARGEQGVLTFEPYKSHLLPLWRFRNPSLASASATALYQKFLDFYAARDFVGMDMARKFVQMGMTRAKRYANYEGGRKYDHVKKEEEGGDGDAGDGTSRVQREKGKLFEGRAEKEEASQIFREWWERCKEHEGYQRLKEEFLREQKAWEKKEKGGVKSEAAKTMLGEKPKQKSRKMARETSEEDNDEKPKRASRKRTKSQTANPSPVSERTRQKRIKVEKDD